MCNLITELKLDSLLEKHGVSKEQNNFEKFYSSICETKPKLASEIEVKIYSYFSSLKIPDELTLYDYLILFLREKDCIASFNWDPILNQALKRNLLFLYNYGLQPPNIIYLHGNTAIGHCPNKCTMGHIENRCSKCNTKYVKSQLLYPVSKKNYSINSFVENQWKRVINKLKRAYLLTVFGYSAPSSDQEAMKLFKEGWGDWQKRQFEEIEFINTDNQDIYIESWKDFIHTYHYQYKSDFFDSILAKYPRRSCECLFKQLMECRFLQKNMIPKSKAIYDFLNPLMCKEADMTRIKIEVKRQKDGKILRTIEESIGGKNEVYLLYAKPNKYFINDKGYTEIKEGDFADIIFESAVINIDITYRGMNDDDPRSMRSVRTPIKSKGKCIYRLILEPNMAFSVSLDKNGWDKRFLGTFWSSSDSDIKE